jgi:cell division protein ZapA
MAQVTIRINGKAYDIGCEDGQEPHLQSLAEYLDKKVNELSSAVGQVGEARLLVMAGLLVADELSETGARLQEIETELRGSLKVEAQAEAEARAEAETAAAERLEAAAAELESLSQRLEAG